MYIVCSTILKVLRLATQTIFWHKKNLSHLSHHSLLLLLLFQFVHAELPEVAVALASLDEAPCKLLMGRRKNLTFHPQIQNNLFVDKMPMNLMDVVLSLESNTKSYSITAKRNFKKSHVMNMPIQQDVSILFVVSFCLIQSQNLMHISPHRSPSNLDNLWSCNFGRSSGKFDNFDSWYCCNFGYFDSSKKPARAVEPHSKWGGTRCPIPSTSWESEGNPHPNATPPRK